MKKKATSIADLLYADHTVRGAKKIVAIISDEPSFMSELMQCFFSNDLRLCQWSAHVVGLIGQSRPDLLCSYIPDMIKAAEHPMHNAIVRNVVRAFQYMDIPEDYEGIVYDFCMRQTTDMQQAIAVRAFALKTSIHFALKHKDLASEVKEVLLILEPDESPAIRSVVRYGKKLLK